MNDKTTATERLRELLDERGVEWSKGRYDRREFTRWYIRNNNGYISASFRDVFAGENGGPDLRCEFYDLTPEQAVEATLGRGTCRMTLADLRGPAYTDVYECSECGHQTMVYTVMDESEPPNYCPSCGRRVES